MPLSEKCWRMSLPRTLWCQSPARKRLLPGCVIAGYCDNTATAAFRGNYPSWSGLILQLALPDVVEDLGRDRVGEEADRSVTVGWCWDVHWTAYKRPGTPLLRPLQRQFLERGVRRGFLAGHTQILPAGAVRSETKDENGVWNGLPTPPLCDPTGRHRSNDPAPRGQC